MILNEMLTFLSLSSLVLQPATSSALGRGKLRSARGGSFYLVFSFSCMKSSSFTLHLQKNSELIASMEPLVSYMAVFSVWYWHIGIGILVLAY